MAKTGGLHIALPHLRVFAEQYVRGTVDGNEFVRHLAMAVDSRPWWKILFDKSYWLGLYKWMFDAQTFTQLLTHLTFQNIRECSLRQGKVRELAELDLDAHKH